MFQPWKCPDCATWLASGVTQHRCDDPPTAAAPIPKGPAPIILGGYGNWTKCMSCGCHFVGWHQCVPWGQVYPTAYPIWVGYPLTTCSSSVNVTGTTIYLDSESFLASLDE